LYLSNYAALNVKDELARLGGIGDVQLFGMGDYSLRVWLDPNKTASRNLTATDVVNAIREQNRQVAAGSLGAPPAPGATDFQLSINTQGRLVSEEEFENIIIRAGEDGSITRLGTSHVSNWVPANTRCAPCSTTSPPSPFRFSSALARTRSKSPTRCACPHGRAEEGFP
jgi:hypothetical protein